MPPPFNQLPLVTMPPPFTAADRLPPSGCRYRLRPSPSARQRVVVAGEVLAGQRHTVPDMPDAPRPDLAKSFRIAIRASSGIRFLEFAGLSHIVRVRVPSTVICWIFPLLFLCTFPIYLM